MSRKIFVIFLFIYAQCVVGQQFQKGNKAAEKTALDIHFFFRRLGRVITNYIKMKPRWRNGSNALI